MRHQNNDKYISLTTPYYLKNVRINKVFGDDYSVQGIKERIYGLNIRKQFLQKTNHLF